MNYHVFQIVLSSSHLNELSHFLYKQLDDSPQIQGHGQSPRKREALTVQDHRWIGAAAPLFPKDPSSVTKQYQGLQKAVK